MDSERETEIKNMKKDAKEDHIRYQRGNTKDMTREKARGKRRK